MARNAITGLLFFRLDTNPGDKIKYLLKKQKVDGYGIFILILTRIYRQDGYFCKWDNFNRVLFCDDGIQMEKLEETVACCIEIGLFDKEMFDKHQILTSAEIQSRYLKIMADLRRKGVPIAKDYLLLTSEEIPNKLKQTAIPSEEIQQHSVETAIPSAKSAISSDKGKERKGNETKGNYYIKIGGQMIMKKPSEAIEEKHGIRLSAVLSSSLRDMNEKKPELFDRFDLKYNGHDFRDANHLFNALSTVAEEIRNPKKKSTYSAKAITPNIDEIKHE